MTNMLLLAAFLVQPVAPVAPAPANPPCTEADRRLPEALAAWNRAPRTGGRGAAVAANQPVRVALEETARVGFAQPPERAPAPGSRGAAVAVEVPRAGRYQVALSGPVWIDVVAGMARVASTAHGHGPRCSTIRKLVSFDLPAGRHLIQLSGTTARDVTLMLVPPPGT